ncbi:unnamed protein product [Adineta steineri]|uniref:HTH CENPB-type domain-containing protein n=2 Tax=Adineta steineri TaxID=433720 RepID=A0A819YHJ7_9BILA|nr:unnamed protein product [Adineta steineri]
MKRSHQKYFTEKLQQAIKAYSDGSMSSVEAAEHCGVPQSTVRNHKRQPAMKIGSGRPFLLSKTDEEYLVELLLSLERMNIRLTKNKVLKIAEEFIKNLKQSEQQLGRHWFEDFMKRNKDKIKFIKEQKLERSRKEGLTDEIRKGWFDTVFTVMQQLNLFDKPAQVYNVDECGFNDDTQRKLVLVSADTKIKYEENGGTGKSFTTMIICVNAKGDTLPPLTVYAAKKVKDQWTNGAPDRSTFQCSHNGWINDDIFYFWFINVFLTEIQSIPPKTSWKKIVSSYFERTHRKTIRKIDYPSLLTKLFGTAFTPRQVVAGFSRSGIWPYDRNVVKEKVNKTTVTQSCSMLQPSMSHDDTSTISTSVSMISLSNNSHLSFDDVLNDNTQLSVVPLPTTVNQAIQLLDSVISSVDNGGNGDNSFAKQQQQQQQQHSFSDGTSMGALSRLPPPPMFGFPSIYSQTSTIPSPSASSSGFFRQSPVRPVDPFSFSDDEEFDHLLLDSLSFQRRPSSSQFSSKLKRNSILIQQNSVDDADVFLVNSSLRTYTELTNVPILPVQVPPSASILPVQVPSSASILPSYDLSSITTSTDPSVSSPRILTPSTVAKAIYNQVLIEQPPPSSSTAKPSSRVRQQRKFGEVVTSDSFLNEIKENAEKKLAKSKSGTSNGVQKKKTSYKQNKTTEKSKQK